ncbi:MAG: hypothetical protein HeimC2_33620 [Candidatus Heimdallarchaeota archaeon LC_2]|nr:MAG: hypothetical protein HeimC2_33620 [Candidatus Heimdallarchaeota archaeon LC_2]
MNIVTEITIEKLNQHLVDIKIEFTTSHDNPILEMPSWTPGSYLIREYARHVQNLKSLNIDGNNLQVDKVSKNNWKIICASGTRIVVNYEVYAFELTVRTSYLDNRKALLIPASLCMYIVNHHTNETSKDEEITLKFNIPSTWKMYSSLLKKENDYFVKNFDELVDTPIAMGSLDVIKELQYNYDDNGKEIPNTVVFVGDASNEDINKFALDLQKLQDCSIKMFGKLPYNRYIWLLYITNNGRGGLEHKYSNASIIPRYMFKDPKDYAKVLSLEAHEHFHVYNVKRIRPQQLGPFDYSSEVYTRLLWVAEGLTSFYDNIFLARSQLVDRNSYWEMIADDLKRYYQIPGRFIDSIESSSFDAWIKLYRPDENSVNSTISYYLKGGIVGMMLDLEIRSQTNWNASLDTFYKYMFGEYEKDPTKGFIENDLQSLIESSTSTDLTIFWTKYISGKEEIDLEKYLNILGMNIEKSSTDNVPYAGINFKVRSTSVQSILRDSPAEKAGLYAKDEIIALNGYKVTSKNFEKVLKNHESNDLVNITLFRDGKLIDIDLRLENPIMDKIAIVEAKEITDQQKKLLDVFFYS